MPGLHRGLLAGGLLLAIAGCVSTSGAPTPLLSSVATGSAPVASVSVAPLPIAAMAVTTASVSLNAPYSYGGYQAVSNGYVPVQEAAGYPTAALLTLSFTNSAGSAAAPADVWWTSSNPELVVVDANGWVRTVDPGTWGTATVTATLKSNPQISASASVTVTNDGKLQLEVK
jgi:hypothetical protein